jgi:hypothetical protein
VNPAAATLEEKRPAAFAQARRDLQFLVREQDDYDRRERERREQAEEAHQRELAEQRRRADEERARERQRARNRRQVNARQAEFRQMAARLVAEMEARQTPSIQIWRRLTPEMRDEMVRTGHPLFVRVLTGDTA